MSRPTREQVEDTISAVLIAHETSLVARGNSDGAFPRMVDALMELFAAVPDRWRPAWAVLPGEILQEEIDERGMSQAALADLLGCAYQHVNRVCRGHVRIEAPFALRLEKALGISAMFWLGLQATWDLHKLRTAPVVAGEPESTPAAEPSIEADQLARLFHETYERLAPTFGYETRKASAVPWDDVPDQNKRLMVAVASEVLREFRRSGSASADTQEAPRGD